ncbi:MULTISPECIES: helix-turn-helix transcriptional regulator [unclassified Solwaraspora]|uniref:helix-turn-helix transcriptional regulator n=1 Tax=unclassified Solwaraspora TaxID=2627926 RepID=UPI00248D21A4|nr:MULTISPECIES: helix-turn-helix transcriptional regulator [unclassified Solwaraspora]WBB96795.1 helix-turn-helix transcriptional regulator [Solwaraspora sp. WMMA2059]WBC19300.1 helix-turn-helix transcriptional regulator [Solwaraspora sp. WMMA2080]WJK33257.1 helix-turn-helix transcriptional regulator [Solwaraspora sp. WMMA2065]
MAVKRRRFVERRKALGFSQETLAEKIGVDRTTIARLEHGVTTPYPYTRLKLCKILEVTAEQLDHWLMGGDEDLSPPVPTPRPTAAGPVPVRSEPTGVLDDMHRRELLRLISVAGALTALPTGSHGAALLPATLAHEAGDLDQYAELNAHLWQVFGLTRPKRLVYPLVQEQAAVLVDRLDRAPTGAEHRRLCVLACDLFQLAGEIFFDADQYAEAAHCYSLAASAGRESRSYDRWACALTRQAFVNLYDQQYSRAVTVLDAAARIAQRGDSQLSTRHWVAAVQAQAFAGLGDREACEHALDTAEQVHGLNGPASPGGWLRFDGSRICEERGACHLALGQVDLAERALFAASDGTMSPRRRGGILADLALLSAQRTDIDRMLRYGSEAVGIAEQTHSVGYLGRKVQGFQRQLTPALLADAQVAQLNDRITGLLTAAA